MTAPSPRRPTLGFWTGTRPGLERVLLASVPALVVGTLVGAATRPLLGYLVGYAMIVATVLVGRRARAAGPGDDAKPT